MQRTCTMANPVGCPPKYTPERLAAILQSISNRIPYKLAAEANGIRECTLYDWINQGWDEKDQGLDTPLAKFSEDIKKIEENLINGHFKKMNNNVERWQADAWILERRFYKHFGANVHLQEMDERLKKIEAQSKEKDSNHGQET
jgi:hypothetical protein